MKILTGKEAQEAERFLEQAALASKNSRCLKRPRGCVIVKNGKIVAEGANAPADDQKCTECLRDKKKPLRFEEFNTEPCYSVHAEQRAILNTLKSNYTLEGAKLYFTHLEYDGDASPINGMSCTICSKLMLESGLESFICLTKQGIAEFSTKEVNDLSFKRLEEEE